MQEKSNGKLWWANAEIEFIIDDKKERQIVFSGLHWYAFLKVAIVHDYKHSYCIGFQPTDDNHEQTRQRDEKLESIGFTVWKPVKLLSERVTDDQQFEIEL